MNIPFDKEKLDRLMEEQGVDLVVATTRFNIQHMLGGYRYFFFANMDAIGLSRYLPALAYRRGKAEDSFYIGCDNEGWGTETFPFWVPAIELTSWSSTDTARSIATAVKRRGLDHGTIAVEMAFLPADAWDVLRTELPDVRFVEAQKLLEALRAVKSPRELELVKKASVGIIESMTATFKASSPGESKIDIVERFRREQTNRGMVFDYCLVSTGQDFNRAPSDRIWNEGEVLSLDSGGMYEGYIGDLARMAVAGDPTPAMVDILDEIEHVQQAARKGVGPGLTGEGIFAHAHEALAGCAHRNEMRFVAHGMGLITHEAPRMTSTGPVPYPGDHESTPLEPGMILSIETWVENPQVGFVKLEDTLIVTEDGWEAPGDFGRGWNQPGR
jgi:Xaa-Pro aminopeptidase